MGHLFHVLLLGCMRFWSLPLFPIQCRQTWSLGFWDEISQSWLVNDARDYQTGVTGTALASTSSQPIPGSESINFCVMFPSKAKRYRFKVDAIMDAGLTDAVDAANNRNPTLKIAKLVLHGHHYPESACPVGTYATTETQASCVDCAAGMYQTETGKLMCLDPHCAMGKYLASNRTWTPSCEDCAAGKYSYDKAVCLDCAMGTYTDEVGQSSCKGTACIAGQYQTSGQAGQTSATACTSCNNGTYSTTTTATSCISCAAGTYQTETGKTVCTSCAAGKYSTSGTTQTAASVCIDCEAGKYMPEAGKTTACIDCPAGTYNAQTGQSVPFQLACKSCHVVDATDPTLFKESDAPASLTSPAGSTALTDCAAA